MSRTVITATRIVKGRLLTAAVISAATQARAKLRAEAREDIAAFFREVLEEAQAIDA